MAQEKREPSSKKAQKAFRDGKITAKEYVAHLLTETNPRDRQLERRAQELRERYAKIVGE
jgi:hypothetical protein